MRKEILVILGFVVLVLALPQIKAEDTTEDTTVDIIVIGEGNVTGYINCTSVNGSVSYYIDGIEVKGEFDKVWSSISRVRKTAQRAHSLAGSAYRYADNNHDDIVELLIISENNTNKIYILRDELVSFENEYIVFKNNTNTTFTQITYRIKNLREDVTSLQEADKELEKNIHMLWISIMGLLVCFGLMIWVGSKRNKKLEKKIDKMEKG